MADTGVNIKIENIVEAFKMMVQFVYMGARTIVKKKDPDVAKMGIFGPSKAKNGSFWG